MNQIVIEREHGSEVQPERRDIYRVVHKALRAWMANTLVAVGRMDAGDEEDCTRTLAQVRALLGACDGHLNHENRFVHTAMEARSPGASESAAQDHVEHLHALARLEGLIRRVEQDVDAARVKAARDLYAELALFVAENLAHMHKEETDNNKALWLAYTDAEIGEIHDALVASIPPQEMAAMIRWMVPSISPSERVELLSGIRATAPAEVFDAVMAIGAAHLSAAERTKLDAALAA